MKASKDLIGRFGANMRESMAAENSPGAAPALPQEAPAKFRGTARLRDALRIDLDRIAPDPNQPRKEFDPGELADLAESLRSRGQLQPVRVRWEAAMERWVIVVGERRYRAAALAGLPSLVCIEATGQATPEDVLEDQLVENALRSDLKPIEQANAYRTLLGRRGWSHRQLAEALRISPGSVAKALALLDLPDGVQQQVDRGALAPAAAYELSKVTDPGEQAALAGRVVAEGLTVTEAAAAVRRVSGRAAKGKGRGAGKGKPRKVTSAVIRAATGAKVTVEFRKGLDDATVLAALEDAVTQVRTRLAGGDGQAAA
jgi:ParB family chromosome partitioning protein